MILAVFARPHHPPGYGYPDGTGSFSAHGYVVLVVRARSHEELQRLQDLLRWDARVYRWADRPDRWYAGPYELVWAVSVDEEAVGRAWSGQGITLLGNSWISLGDNRAVAYVDAAALLGRVM